MVGRQDPAERIFEGLLLALARHGVARTSMTDVSTEAGISRGTLYRYFSTKDELLDGLSRYLVDDVRQRLERRLADVTGPEDRIAATMTELQAFIEQRPSLERLAALEPEFVIEWFRVRYDELTCAVGTVVTLGVDNGDRRPEDVRMLSGLLVRLMLSFQLLPPQGGHGHAKELGRVVAAFSERTVDA